MLILDRKCRIFTVTFRHTLRHTLKSLNDDVNYARNKIKNKNRYFGILKNSERSTLAF